MSSRSPSNSDDLLHHPELVEALGELDDRTKHAVMIADFETALFVEANSAALEMFGYSLSELRTLTPRALSALPQPQHLAISEDLQRRGEAIARGLPLTRKDRTDFFADLYVRTCEVDGHRYNVSLLFDVPDGAADNALCKAEQQLFSSERLYRGLVNAVHDAVIVCDLADFTVVDANPAACKQLGYRPDEWKSLRALDLHPPDAHALISAAMDDVQRDGHARVENAPVLTKSGERRGVDLQLNVYVTRGQRLLVGVARDETELRQKRHELERANLTLREAQAKLLHTQKLAAVGEVAAGVAHEINTPAAFLSMNLAELRSEVGKVSSLIAELRRLVEEQPDDTWRETLSELLTKREIDTESVLSMLTDNEEGVRRIRSVATDLRIFSRVETADVTEVQLNQVVKSTVNLLANEVRHRAELTLDLGDVPTFNAESGKLAQVVTNLILNAVQSIEEGAAAQHRVWVTTKKGDDTVVLMVRDTGSGMSPEVLAHIFDPFFTTKSREQGTGLGLSLCMEIVSRHGGTLCATSELGTGSTFVMTLPIANGLKRRPSKKKVPPPSATRAARILVVDDDPSMLRAYRRLLADLSVVVVGSGAAAIEQVRSDCAFDLVLCDLMMPEVDGRQVHAAFSEIAPQLISRLVFCTGGAFTERARRWVESIDNPVFEKPITRAMIDGILGALEEDPKAMASDPTALK